MTNVDVWDSFNGPMVRAILEGRKTMTRRIVKPQPVENPKGLVNWAHKGCSIAGARPSALIQFIPCPFGQPGDELWLRETWRTYQLTEEEGIQFKSDGTTQQLPDKMEEEELAQYQNAENWENDPPQHGPWRSSTTMPRWASRIQLRVKAIHMQRVQDITEEDARANGFDEWVPCMGSNGLCHFHSRGSRKGTCKEHFKQGWDDDYNDGDHPCFDSNPWVWAVEFERI